MRLRGYVAALTVGISGEAMSASAAVALFILGMRMRRPYRSAVASCYANAALYPIEMPHSAGDVVGNIYRRALALRCVQR